MPIFLFLFLFCCSVAQLRGQSSDHGLNVLGQLSYNEDVANIWGYVDSSGREYALVGTQSGLSIVSLDNPGAPQEVQHIPGFSSIWREVRTWGHYAYFVCEEGSDGLTIVDLRNLPQQAPFQRINPVVDLGAGPLTLFKSHTIHIDERGRMYLFGSDLNDGGALIFDLVPDPLNPVFLGATRPEYAHDGYVRGDSLYTADIRAGFFTAHDISDPSDIQIVATQNTPSAFTHNVWHSDDSLKLFTTDERGDAWVTAYDISDLSNIRELDRWRDLEVSGHAGVIPHNVHVLDDFLFVSYYSAGLIILDGKRASNLAEVARYDSYPFARHDGFRGAWGVYPYLPSGLVLVSDINTGLHILEKDFGRAAWIEGLVTDSLTGQVLRNAEIRVLARPYLRQSNLRGRYKQSVADTGFYLIEFRAAGYETKTLPLQIAQRDTVYDLDAQLRPFASSLAEVPHTKPLLRVGPNPSSTSFWLEAEEPGQIVRLFDSQGRLLWEQKLLDRQFVFGQELSAGIYILDCAGEQHRLIKQ